MFRYKPQFFLPNFLCNQKKKKNQAFKNLINRKEPKHEKLKHKSQIQYGLRRNKDRKPTVLEEKKKKSKSLNDNIEQTRAGVPPN